MRQRDRKLAVKYMDWLTQGLIVLHLIFISIYLDADSLLMSGLSGLAALAVFLALRQLRSGRLRVHMWIVYITELVSLIAAALLVGWSAGLQLPLVGLTGLVFLAEYVGRTLSLDYVRAMPLGIANAVSYVGAYLFFYHKSGLLGLPAGTGNLIGIVWSIPVFALLILGMWMVLRMTSDSERSLSDKAQTDPLTGLHNRAGFDRLQEELCRETTTLLLVDTDKFKGINDHYGHETGDRVLQHIARELERHFRQVDHVCRIGGDEFAVLMLETEALKDEIISGKVTQINHSLSRSTDDHLPAVSVSVGVAHGSDSDDWTSLYKNADSALYRVKAAGGRGCDFYSR